MSSIPTVDCGDALEADSDISDGANSDVFEHDNTENMAQPSNADDISRLEALPDEILTMVFQQLFEYESWRWDNNRRHFRSFCLVSKRIEPIARPFLFKRIEISCPRVLVKLYRTISEAQSLGEEIREIRLSPSRLYQMYLMPRESATEWQELWDECCQVLGDRGLQISEEFTNGQDLVNIVCNALLGLTVNLSSLKMNVDVVEVEDKIGSENPKYRGLFMNQKTLGPSDIVSGTTGSTVRGGILPRLKNLTLKSTYGRPVSVKVLKRVLDLPSLETIKIEVFSEGKGFLTPRHELPELLAHLHGESSDSSSGRLARKHITAFDLSDTSVRPRDVEDIARLFPYLEVLSVGPGFRPSYSVRGHMSSGRHPYLSTALGKLLALRILRINLYPDDLSGGLYNALTASVGPRGFLDLAQLPNLQEIEVPLYMVADGVPRQILPRSLKTLELLSHHECDRNAYDDYLCCESEYTALGFLESLGEDLPCLPRLQSVAYCWPDCAWSDWSAVAAGQGNEEAEDSTQTRVRAISASFSKQNVQFLVK